MTDSDLHALRCRALETQSGQGTWWGDPAEGPLQLSDAAGHLLGLAPGPQAPEAILSVLHPEDRAVLAAAWRQAPVQGAEVETRVRIQGSGPERWLGERRFLAPDGRGQVAVLRDLREPSATAERVDDLIGRLRELSGELVRVQEHERRHLARELHDEIGQQLTALLISVRNPQRRLSAALRASLVAEINGLIESVRDVSLDLRPALLDDLGLVPALRTYAEREARRGGLALDLVLPERSLRLRPDLETALFRIAQEAVTNVLRHARAQRLTLVLETDRDPVRLCISDDGKGFEHAPRPDGRRHFGLLGMRERARLLGGDARVGAAPDGGTRVEAWVPRCLAAEPRPQALSGSAD